MTSTSFSNYNNNNSNNNSCFFGSWWQQVDDGDTANNNTVARKRPRKDLLQLSLPKQQPPSNTTTTTNTSSSSSSSSSSYKYYTDADFAKDMNALTVQERQRVNEDIHDVPDVIVESPPSFLQAKHDEFQTVLKNLTSKSFRRTAWDRAVFLRPSLQKDQDHALVFLRPDDLMPLMRRPCSCDIMKPGIYWEEMPG